MWEGPDCVDKSAFQIYIPITGTDKNVKNDG